MSLKQWFKNKGLKEDTLMPAFTKDGSLIVNQHTVKQIINNVRNTPFKTYHGRGSNIPEGFNDNGQIR